VNTDESGLGLPGGLWPAQLTGTDVELLLREESVGQLGNGLYALADVAERHVAEYDELSAADVAARSVSAQSLPPDIRELAAQRMAGMLADFEQDWDGRIAALAPDDVGEVPDPFGWAAERFGGRPDAHIDALAAAFTELPRSRSSLGYLVQYAAAAGRDPRLPAMRRALLVTTVSSAELILSGVIHRVLFDREGGSWQSPSLDKAVNKLMAGGIEKWETRFPEILGIDLPRTSCNLTAVKEIWARRNVLVHNGGIADQKYCRRVSGVAPGTLLEVSAEYLRTAIDLVCGFLFGIIYIAWGVAPGRRQFVAYRAAGNAVVAESEHRWPMAENLNAIAAFLETDLDEAARSQVNAWLARARWRGPDSVLADVSAWETIGLPPVFTVARLILAGQIDNAIAMIPQLVVQGELTDDDLLTWPLFEPVRNNSRFKQLLK